jgi:hypothetical protein
MKRSMWQEPVPLSKRPDALPVEFSAPLASAPGRRRAVAASKRRRLRLRWVANRQALPRAAWPCWRHRSHKMRPQSPSPAATSLRAGVLRTRAIAVQLFSVPNIFKEQNTGSAMKKGCRRVAVRKVDRNVYG